MGPSEIGKSISRGKDFGLFTPPQADGVLKNIINSNFQKNQIQNKII